MKSERIRGEIEGNSITASVTASASVSAIIFHSFTYLAFNHTCTNVSSRYSNTLAALLVSAISGEVVINLKSNAIFSCLLA